jgi:hypothetical protein
MMSARCVSTAEPLILTSDDFESYSADDVAVRLEYIAASVRSQTVKARMYLAWRGTGEPPKALWIQLQFHNFDGSNAGWMSEPVRIGSPFKNGGERTLETSFGCGSCANLPRNLYASASIRTRANVDRKLVYEVGELAPVVVQE